MKVVALVSGGKDSLFNLMKCISYGHDVIALANLYPAPATGSDELDSYMYQTVGHDAIELYSDAIGLPLYRHQISGTAKATGSSYEVTSDDEVEDLYVLLRKIKAEISFDAVSVGAILSNYQRIRVEHVCSRLGLKCLAFLWRKDQKLLMKSMLDNKVNAILIKVAALGLEPMKHLGKSLSDMFNYLCLLEDKYGCHVCGEGGEYETLTLDCPLFIKKLELLETKVVIHSDDAFAPVGYLQCTKIGLKDKGLDANLSLPERLHETPLWEAIHHLPLNHESQAEKPKEASPLRSMHAIPIAMESFQLKESGNQTYPSFFISHDNDYVTISGITCLSESTTPMEESCKQSLDLLQEQLRCCNSDVSLVLMTYLYVADMTCYPAINEVYSRYFVSSPPARVCIEAHLPEDVTFQISCIAVTKSCPAVRSAMHVQSISEWAPANIGPYSQSVTCDGLVFVSGCIGLIPELMSITTKGASAEAHLSLQHVISIAEASNADSISNAAVCVCYISNQCYSDIATMTWNEATDNVNAPLSCVVIPRLPRDANFEWHLILPTIDKPPADLDSIYDAASCRVVPSTAENRHHLFAMKSFDISKGACFSCKDIARQLLLGLKSIVESARPSFLYLHVTYNREKFSLPIDDGALTVAIREFFKGQFDIVPGVIVLASDWLNHGDLAVNLYAHVNHNQGAEITPSQQKHDVVL